MRESVLVVCLLLLFTLPLMSVSASGISVSDKREYSIGSANAVTYVSSCMVISSPGYYVLREIVLDYEREAGKDYSVKACTSQGECSEVSLKAPEKEKEGEER